VAVLTVGPGWYCGVAPVPGGRVNVGVVVPEATLRAAAGDGRPGAAASRVLDDIVALLPGPAGDEPWRWAPRTDAVTVALPLAHRPRRLAGPGWLLVGDAAGFLDPLSGEGLHRALASARLAADAIEMGDRGRPGALLAYDRRMRARFDGKDALSWLLQGFLARPELAAYAVTRLGRRGALARTFNAVLTDLAPASRALDPRFLLRLLAP
jgi:flavin-dependent dehydrogenase